MNIKVFYNEIDPYCCAWLSNLMDKGCIRPGKISDKSIVDLTPEQVSGYDLAHFFAGIGGWDLALTLAGWRIDGRVTWTGSCPCQPFSAAGKKRGCEDERHLWPAFCRLIGECSPAVVVGEQVAGAGGLAWWDHVATDLEGAAYAVAAANLGAHSVGAPHIRQRLYWVAHADGGESRRRKLRFYADSRDDNGAQRIAERSEEGDAGGIMGDTTRRGFGECRDEAFARSGRHVDCANPWHTLLWLPCRDGKSRPTQPGLFPLAHGISSRVGRLRGYGNAIVPQVGAEFVKAVMECAP